MRVEDSELDADIEATLARVAEHETLLETHAVPNLPADWTPNVEHVLDRDLLVHVDLDTLVSLVASASTGPDARANTGLEDVLAAPQVSAGPSGRALTFDGQNFLNLTEIADFDWYSRFTLAAWIKAERQEKDAALFSRRLDEQKRGGYELTRTPDGRLRLLLRHDHRYNVDVATVNRIPIQRWTHVAATYNGSGRASGVQLYIDGTPQRTVTQRDSLERQSFINGNALLAAHWSARMKTVAEVEGLTGGSMDGIRVYARDLTAAEVAHLAGAPPADPGAFYRTHFDRGYQRTVFRLDSLRRALRTVPFVMVMEEMDSPRPTFVLERGQYDAPTDSVGRGTPHAILPFSEDFPPNRLGLSRWLFHADNPLTARVAVNRIWQMLFGEGLVRTPEDFGNQGALPTHPALLDFLAVQYAESGWDTKALLKSIVLSATYRQSGASTPSLRTADPDNMLWARGPSQRLTAEMMRDNALQVSGLLNPAMGGEPVRPYQPAGLWKALANQVGENRYRPGPDVHRRSLYTYWKRTIPPPSMLTFDASERVVCAVERQSTSTPLQALVLLNDPQYIEAARVMAAASLALTDRDALAKTFRLLTSRSPEPEEIGALEQLLGEQLDVFREAPDRAQALVRVGQSALPAAYDAATLAARTVVTSTILNLDEAQHR